MLIKRKIIEIQKNSVRDYADFPLPKQSQAKHARIVDSDYQEQEDSFQLEAERRRLELETMIAQEFDRAKAEAEQIIRQADLIQQEKLQEIERAFQLLKAEENKIQSLAEAEYKKAFNEGMTKAETLINNLIGILGTFQSAKKTVLAEAKSEIMVIALDIAKQILGYEVAHNPQLLETQLSRAFDKVMDAKGMMQIYLHPEDMKSAEFLREYLNKVVDPSVRIHFVADAGVSQGSCIVNTQGGRLDASFNTQIEQIKAIFEKFFGVKITELPENQLELVEEAKTLDETNAEEEIKPKKVRKQKQDNSLENKQNISIEPSDDELEELEKNIDQYVDLNIDEDFENLLNGIINYSEEDDMTLTLEKPKANFKLEESEDLGANEVYNQDDEDLEEEFEDEEDSDEDEDEEDYDDDEEDDDDLDDDDEEEEDEDLDDDEEDEEEELVEEEEESDEESDDRFPDY